MSDCIKFYASSGSPVVKDIRDFIPGEVGQCLFDAIVRLKCCQSFSAEEANLFMDMLIPYWAAVCRFNADYVDISLSSKESMAREEAYNEAYMEYSSRRDALILLGKNPDDVPRPEPYFPYKSKEALSAFAAKYHISVEDVELWGHYIFLLSEEFWGKVELFSYAGNIHDVFEEKNEWKNRMVMEMEPEESLRILDEMELVPKFEVWKKARIESRKESEEAARASNEKYMKECIEEFNALGCEKSEKNARDFLYRKSKELYERKMRMRRERSQKNRGAGI